MEKDSNSNGLSLLILEDDEGIAHIQQSKLSRLGLKVEVALNTKQAHDRVAQNGISLLLLDYKLHEPSTGLDFYRSLLDANIVIPAILVTGMGHEDVLAEAIRMGIRGFVLKTDNYWEDLCSTIERVQQQLTLERAALESERIHLNEARMAAAFEAASVCHWHLDPLRMEWSISDVLRKMLPLDQNTTHHNQYLELVVPEDREMLTEQLLASISQQSPFQVEYRVTDRSGGLRWLLSKGSYMRWWGLQGGKQGLTGITIDITERKGIQLKLEDSCKEVGLLNEQLRASMMETHHRVKNSLQLVGSLLNLELRGKESLSAAEAQKMIAHIQAFAALHEILGEQLDADPKESDGLNLTELVEKLNSILQPVSNGRLRTVMLHEIKVSARQASALGIILNELVTNGIRHGKGSIELALQSDRKQGILSVRSEGSSFPEDFKPEQTGRTGLVLIGTIARAELGGEPRYGNDERGWATVQIDFPLDRPASPAV